MSLSVLDCARPRDVQIQPFPHVVLCNALPAGLYDELSDKRPDWRRVLGDKDSGDNLRFDVRARDALVTDCLPRVWRDFIAYHVSQEFWRDIVRVFGTEIRRLYPDLEARLGTALWDATTCVRFDGKAEIELDCQIAINTPAKTRGRVRGPHLDNPKEVLGAMLYMPAPREPDSGGDLLTYWLNDQPEIHGKAELKDGCCAPAGRVPYQANTFVGFVNSLQSVHGVTERGPTKWPRLMVNFVAEVGFPLFSYEPYRVAPR